MPIRRTRRTRTVAPQVHVPKIFLVGPSQSGKTTFVQSFIQQNPYLEIYGNGNIGLEAYPVKYNGKSYNLWDASTHLDEHLLSWGQGSDLIIVFGQDQSWMAKMEILYPQTPIKMYNPESILSNLQI